MAIDREAQLEAQQRAAEAAFDVRDRGPAPVPKSGGRALRLIVVVAAIILSGWLVYLLA
jgi:hypothetical protein